VRRAASPAPPAAPPQGEATHGHVWAPAAATPDAPAHEPAPVLVDDLFSPGFELEASAEPIDEEAAEPEVAETVRAPRPRRRRMVLIAAGVLLVTAGGFAAWKLLGGGSSALPEEEATVAVPKAAVAKVPASATKPGGASTTAGGPSPGERSKQLARTLARGSDAFEAADYEGAILAYNDALALDPANAAARQGILDAGERYKAHKAQAALFDKVRRAFDAGEYESGLRMLYRLPEDAAEPATLVRYKIAGWYNMGVIALRAADCAHAQDHFKEALALQPGDAALREARSLAERCSGQRKDRAFYDTAEALPFRSADR
jgi:tetratricopeptide (TPR) repeat protein